MNATVVAVVAASLLCFGCAASADAPSVRAGVLDLSTWNFEAGGTVAVTGEWQICWGEFVAAGAQDCPRGGWQTFPVPRLWSDSSVSSPIGGKGIASYRATIELPPDAGRLTLQVGSPITAYRLWINGEARGGVGSVGRTPATTVAKLENRAYPLPPSATRIDLLVHVANFEFRGGGLRREIYLGHDEQVRTRSNYELLLYAAFATTSVVIGLIFLAQFAFRPSERARGWFGFVAILFGLRIIPASTGDVYQLLMGWASFDLLLRLEYINTASIIAVGVAYLRDKVPGVMPPRLTQALLFAALALLPIHVFAPLDLVLATITVILVLPPLALLLAIASYGRAVRRRLPGTRSTLVVLLGFLVGASHDIFRTQTGLGAPIELFPYFVVAVIASETRSLLQAFARSFATAEKLSEELQESNFELQETEETVVRFVPFDFLRTLGKKSIRDVESGDHVSADMSVMSCALPIKEQGTFAAIHEMLGRVEPLIRARHGFVSQRLGDRIVALFPGTADDAIEAGLEIRRAIPDANVGIATGQVLLGTVGSETLASISVGPPVDLAQQLLDRARSIGTGVLISGATRDALTDSSRFTLREVGSINPAGPTDPCPVVELVER